MKHIALLLGLITLPTLLLYANDTKYTCPMHPHYISDTDGTCPICGMDLVELTQENDSSLLEDESTRSERKVLYWQAPMNPDYKSDKPGKSPMGMDLVPVYASKSSTNASSVSIDPGMVQNMGVVTENVEMARFGTEIRSYGEVSEDERKRYDVSSRVPGWVETLAVTAVGDVVEKGSLLYELYSPQLISAQQDYLSAIQQGSEGRKISSKKRLVSLGVQDQAIAQVEMGGQYLDKVPFYSEFDGVISELSIKNGSYIKPGMRVCVIQDYSRVWIHISVAEKDLQYLSENMSAKVTFPNLANEVRIAQVDYIYPVIDVGSRTGLVRLVLDNPENRLRPGAYADVVFDTNQKTLLSLPAEAILRSTAGEYVVIALGNGKFQPRNVQTGATNKGRVHIKSGLEVGDSVVVSGQFMIDSESSLRGAFRKMERMEMSLSEISVSSIELAMIDHIIDSALYIHESLVDGFAVSRQMFHSSLESIERLLIRFKDSKLEFVLEDARAALIKAQESITESKLKNALAKLVLAVRPWILKGKPNHYKDKGIMVFADSNSENSWIQEGNKPINPYSNGPSLPVEWINASVKMNEGLNADR